MTHACSTESRYAGESVKGERIYFCHKCFEHYRTIVDGTGREVIVGERGTESGLDETAKHGLDAPRMDARKVRRGKKTVREKGMF